MRENTFRGKSHLIRFYADYHGLPLPANLLLQQLAQGLNVFRSGVAVLTMSVNGMLQQQSFWHTANSRPLIDLPLSQT